MKLYIYDHCPFCVKARMIFGLKNHPIQMITLANNDESTPVNLIGKKMLPILQLDDGTAMGESLDIINFVEQLDGSTVLSSQHSPQLWQWLKNVQGTLNHLIMPVVPQKQFAEFPDQPAREYFINKKQAIVGDFSQLITNRAEYVSIINIQLQSLAELITNPHSFNQNLSLDDIHLFPVLRSLTLINEIEWPQSVATLRDNLSKQSGVPLLFDLAIKIEY